MPKPTSRAISSTGASLSSSSVSAADSRWPSSQACGVVPVVALNRRAKLRGLISARRARIVHADVVGEVRAGPLQDDAEQVVLAPGHGRVDELRLPAVAVRRHDHLAGQRVGGARAPLPAHQVQQGVDAGGGAGPGEDLAVVDVEHPGSTSISGKRAASSPAHCQCVVTRMPSSRPAAASTKTPVQWLTSIAPRACAARSASSRASDGMWSNSSHAVIEHDVGPLEAVQAVLDQHPEAGVGPQDARRLRDHREVEPRQTQVPAVVGEHLVADAEAEAADEPVGHDGADDEGTVGERHAGIMAENLRWRSLLPLVRAPAREHAAPHVADHLPDHPDPRAGALDAVRSIANHRRRNRGARHLPRVRQVHVHRTGRRLEEARRSAALEVAVRRAQMPAPA